MLAFACFADAPGRRRRARGRAWAASGTRRTSPTGRSPCSRRSPSTTRRGSARRSPRSRARSRASSSRRRPSSRRCSPIEALDDARATRPSSPSRRSRSRATTSRARVDDGRRRRPARHRSADSRGRVPRRLPAALRRPPGRRTPRSRSRRSSRSSAAAPCASPTRSCTTGSAAVTSPGSAAARSASSPTMLVDAAHNPHGAAALVAALDEYFDFDEVAFVIGVLADKDAARHRRRARRALGARVPRDAVRLRSRDRDADELAAARRRAGRAPTACSRRAALDDALDDGTRLGGRGAEARASSSPARSRSSARPWRSPPTAGGARMSDATSPRPTRAGAAQAPRAALDPAEPRLDRARLRGRSSCSSRRSSSAGLAPTETARSACRRGSRSRRRRPDPRAGRHDRAAAVPRGASRSAGRCRSLILATGFLDPAMFVVGGGLRRLWVVLLVVGARIDREQDGGDRRPSGTGTGMTT